METDGGEVEFVVTEGACALHRQHGVPALVLRFRLSKQSSMVFTHFHLKRDC